VKLQVADAYAGRQAKCPTCKALVPIPQPAAHEPLPPAIDGHASSLDKLGLAGAVKLPQQGKSSPKPPVKPVTNGDTLPGNKPPGQRLVVAGEIARGGMGAVLRAVDSDIHREIAVKYMLDTRDPKKKIRFIEEAQITGQLEHPNIVPIHELGADAQGRLFFTMKLVHGRSLREILDAVRANPRSAPSLAWFLNVLVNACNALAYAHSRGVIHRDLKPGNIMVGDFGEVYVMDWGLAKVIPIDDPNATIAIQSSSVSSKLVTDRGNADEVTVEGEVLGTPVYMPPEQAAGRVADLDARSDVYSLGAILYEILTLTPPYENQGGYVSTIMKVIEGGIEAPHLRAPERARKGKIPPELAAIAMKALQRDRGTRYQNVAALRQDIDRFREGRAVSAKEDTTWEAVRKLAWRHPGTALASAVASVLLLVVLIVSVRINYRARVAAENAYAEKETQARASVPSFVLAAQLFARQKDLDSALKQIDAALRFDPANDEAHRLKAVLLIAHQDYATAHAELERYLQRHPDDGDAAVLAGFCAGDHPEINQLSLADQLSRQGMPELADLLSLKAQERVELYRRRIREAYGFTPDSNQLRMDAAGKISLNFWAQPQVKDLSALRGMSISHLTLGRTPVESLTPLAGMPLESLNIRECPNLKDLGPLRGMKLTALDLSSCRPRDLSLVREFPLVSLNISNCNLMDLNLLRNMPLQHLDMSFNPVQDLSPLAGKKIARLHMTTCRPKDFGVLRDMPLVELHASGSGFNDLSILRGKPLKQLNLSNCPISNLAALHGMALNEVYIGSCKQVASLAPLRGQPVHTLDIANTGVDDLSDLEGMPLRFVAFTPASIKRGVDVVRNCKSVQWLDSAWPPRTQPAEFWKRYDDSRKAAAPTGAHR
jgi:serine/threonine protein kinase